MNDATIHASAPKPPVAVSVWLYAVPTLPAGSVGLVVTTSGVTVNVNCRAPKFALLPSVAWTMNVYAPTNVGVPLKSPPVERVIPIGRVPPVTAHVMDPGAQHALS